MLGFCLAADHEVFDSGNGYLFFRRLIDGYNRLAAADRGKKDKDK